MTARMPPVPSSTVTPRPSASAEAAPTVVPATVIRSPSSASPAAPVETPKGSGNSNDSPRTRSASASRIVRWP